MSAKPILGTDDLVRPNLVANVPGYGGYTSQLKYTCGHTYGYHSDKLNRKNTVNKNGTVFKDRLLPVELQDQRYGQHFVSGYTGFVPQHTFNYGKTYNVSSKEAIRNFKHVEMRYKDKETHLHETVKNSGKLNIQSNYLNSLHNHHPGLSGKKLFPFEKQTSDFRLGLSLAPISGYRGFVPRKHDHCLGSCYSLWTKHAYYDARNKMQHSEQLEGENIGTEEFKLSPELITGNSGSENVRFGSIYNKHLGMVPNYTGYIPNRRFDCGVTYGDSTRQLPACSNISGYVGGLYNNQEAPITRTVIPVRM